MKIVITAGHFNPLHAGHIELFEKAKALGDVLWVIVKNNHQSFLKRGCETFQDEQIRIATIHATDLADKIILSTDQDLSVNNTLEKIIIDNPNATFILAKGGDAKYNEVFEEAICKKYNVTIIKDLGEKISASREQVGSTSFPS